MQCDSCRNCAAHDEFIIEAQNRTMFMCTNCQSKYNAPNKHIVLLPHRKKEEIFSVDFYVNGNQMIRIQNHLLTFKEKGLLQFILEKMAKQQGIDSKFYYDFNP